MPTTYEKRDGQQYSTVVCDDCGAVYNDGRPDAPGSSALMRAHDEGWGMYRPNAYYAANACPDCLPAARRRHPPGSYAAD